MSAAKTVLVVGANRGIGLQLIRTFEARGWNTIGSIQPETLAASDASIADLRRRPSTCGIIEVDHKDEDNIKKAAQNLLQQDIKLDVLVNSGGLYEVQPQKWDAHQADDLMERFQVMVVLQGPFLVTKHFLPLLTKDGTGRITYITSDSGSISFPNHTGNFIGYRMAESAANQQVKTLAIDFKRDGGDLGRR
ncbi:hypothetical protein B0T24DRAFT_597363 [Lasiosphaeria ovina]|uniref:Uncharacterized protein n=1 Tax=Lasiosphaeria ovina TaxID=92902 RepID=A0AAE0JX52_9PEZI|nr:hypothetical protein B0T24DRAFT_597363 [Lasiosphaeria ovina]